LPGSQLLNAKGESDIRGVSKGGIMPFNMTWLPELLFAFVIAFSSIRGLEVFAQNMSFGLTFLIWTCLSAWSYIWMQTGHAAILPWDKIKKIFTLARDNTLTPVVHFICKITGIKYMAGGKYTEAYVWAFAAVKGFLIGLPVGGFVLAVLWPLGYEIGSHAKNKLNGKVSWDIHMVSEGASGAGAGIACCVWMEMAILLKGLLYA
jgi:hypothetical protein